jgi:hypothetical protein
MNDLFSKVTPITSGIIWIAPEVLSHQTEMYKSMDYLLNGLLTSSLKDNPGHTSRVLITQNFHQQLAVFIFNRFMPNEYESYLNMIKENLTSEQSILVIDEGNFYQNLIQSTPHHFKSFLHLY